MHRLLLAALSAAAAAAVPQQPDNASDRRALQAGVDLASICAADISGAARGVPDGKIDVMDVRAPLPRATACEPSPSAKPARCWKRSSTWH